MSRTDNVTINGQRYNLYHNLQDFVKYTIKKLFETDGISDVELAALLDETYCKKTFDLNYPLLSEDRMKYASDENHPRYYADEIATGYYLCNDWYEGRHADKFAEWLRQLSKS